VFGIALGHEDLNDHDELRHDPMMAILAGTVAFSGLKIMTAKQRPTFDWLLQCAQL
jgi:hypothetical protein